MHCHIYIFTRNHMYTMDTWGYSIIFLIELGCTRYRYYQITSWDAALRRGRPTGDAAVPQPDLLRCVRVGLFNGLV